MKQCLLILTIIFSFFFSSGQNKINRYEYWFDTSYSNLISSSITPIKDFSLNTLINTNNLDIGFHILNLRFEDDSSKFSPVKSNYFFKSSNNVTAYEYWFDDNFLSSFFETIVPNSVVILNTEINTSSLSQGLHRISIRFKDNSDLWTSSVTKYFYCGASDITAYEYWPDDNYANRSLQTITSSQTVDLTQTINVDALNGGYHKFNFRVKDAGGNWSSAKTNYFVKVGSSGINNVITGYRYWLDDNNIITANVTLSAPAAFIQVDDSLNLSFTSIGLHKINIQFRDTSQNWSSVISYNFRNCPDGLPKADFSFALNSSDASFINGSQYSSSYHWIFGDGDTSNLMNPFHHYSPAPAAYHVSLLSKSSCNPLGDTITKEIYVAGLSSIIPVNGGNTGFVSAEVTGGGFMPGMQLFLHRNGEEDIYGDTLIIPNTGLISTTFNLNGKTIGMWDVIVIFPDSKRDTLHNGFTIQAGTASNLWVNITGDHVLRIGFNQVYTVSYGNTGNTDALFVPLGISGLPIGTNIEILDPLFKIDSLPGFDTLNLSNYTLNYSINDSSSNTSFRIFYISKIAAGSSGTCKFIFHVPSTTTLHTYPDIKVVLGVPHSQQDLFRSGRSIVINSHLKDCLARVIGEGFDMWLAKILGIESDFSGIQSCTYSVATETFDGVLEKFEKPDHSSSRLGKILDYENLMLPIIIRDIGCARAGLSGVEGIGVVTLQPEVVIGAVIANEELMAFQIALSSAADVFSLTKDVRDCLDDIKDYTNCKIRPIIGNAHDPNEKYGIGDSLNGHYISKVYPVSYSINFENSPTANLNAQTILITDTLNPAYYDLKSLKFTSVVLGDSIYSLENSSNAFYHDFDFTNQYGVIGRVTGTYDSSTGISKWLFLSIDPLTNQTTTNVLAGILPPDINSPKGQGYVSFNIEPNQTIQNSDMICNKATITFDNNDPITTNCWENIFDLIKPTSQVAVLPPLINSEQFNLSWNGSDNLSGVRSYDIYVSENDSPYIRWKVDATLLSDTFSGKFGNTYSFYSIATDKAGNVESGKTAYEATTTLIKSLNDSACINGNFVIAASDIGNGIIYQWQLDSGTGFENISNSSVYQGATSDTLHIFSVTSSYYGFKYRCIENVAGTIDTSLIHTLHFLNTWTGAVSTAWENVSNWSCNSLPDGNTDVVIESNVLNSPVINSEATCRSLLAKPGISVTVNAGFKLTVTH